MPCVFANNSPVVKKNIPVHKNDTYKISIIHGPYLHGVSDTEATVVWVTDKPAVSWVEIAPDDGSHFYEQERQKIFQSPLGRKVVGTVHSIKIKNLKPATSYNYRVFSRRVVADDLRTFYGAVASTRVYKKEPLKLKTLDATKKEIVFSVVNDIHEKSSFLVKLLKFTPKNVDFLLLNGDMVDYMDSQSQIFKGFLDDVSKFCEKGIPMFMIRGNHETRGAFEHEFMTYFPTPTNKPYYAFRVGPAYFVVVDGGEDKPDSDIEYSDRADFDNYRKEQALWLKNVVNSDEFKKAPVKILLSHIPPAWGAWHGSKHFSKYFTDIINGAGFSVILSGHKHTHHGLISDNKSIKVPNVVNAQKDMMNVKVSSEKIILSFFDENGKQSHDNIIIDVVK